MEKFITEKMEVAIWFLFLISSQDSGVGLGS